MNTKRLENWSGTALAVSRSNDGTFASGAQGLSLELWNTREGVVIKATKRDRLGRIQGATNFRTKVTFK